MNFWSLSSSLAMMEDRQPSMWWHASTTMCLAHTPEPDTIAPLPVRRQRRSKGLKEADRGSTMARLAHSLGSNTLAGGTPVRVYRQRPPGPPRVRNEPAGGAISQRCAGWTACSCRERVGMFFPPRRDPRGAHPPPVRRMPGSSDSCLIRARSAALAVRIPPFPLPPAATPLTGGPGPTGH
jgi:hypothetical protein